MTEPDGVALYGGWVLIVQVASKMPVRGWLHNGKRALSTSDLSARTGCPESVFSRLFELLVSEDLCWLEIASSVLPACYQSVPTCPDVLGHVGTTRPDPTRPGSTGQDITRPDKSLSVPGATHEPDTGADRNGSGTTKAQRFIQLFVLRHVEAFGFVGDSLERQRKPLTAVAARVATYSDRTERMEQSLGLVKEKREAGMTSPVRAWQAEMNRRYPKHG